MAQRHGLTSRMTSTSQMTSTSRQNVTDARTIFPLTTVRSREWLVLLKDASFMLYFTMPHKFFALPSPSRKDVSTTYDSDLINLSSLIKTTNRISRILYESL